MYLLKGRTDLAARLQRLVMATDNIGTGYRRVRCISWIRTVSVLQLTAFVAANDTHHLQNFDFREPR